jgi:hypothetical protein
MEENDSNFKVQQKSNLSRFLAACIKSKIWHLERFLAFKQKSPNLQEKLSNQPVLQ